jgi:AhpD family alkylhydroperoxidase
VARDDERFARSQEAPIVGGLPDVPGIRTAIGLTPALGSNLLGLADALLVDEYPGATIDRAEREMLAEAVSAANDCFFCMDSHGAHAAAVLEKAGETQLLPLIDAVKIGSFDAFSAKMRALIKIAAFSMYNRMVEGFRARTPSDLEMYQPRAMQIAEHGYSPRPSPAAASRD